MSTNAAAHRHTDLSAFLERVLDSYQHARASEKMNASHPLWGEFRAAQAALTGLAPVRQREDILVKWSVGQGAWAKVPWIALLDSRETKFTNNGVYVIYLFRMDMSGVYLTLNQGVSGKSGGLGTGEARCAIVERAAELRGACEHMRRAGFRLDTGIDLRANHKLGADYEAATIAYRLYETGAIPSTSSLTGDLAAALADYDAYLKTHVIAGGY